MIRVCHVVPVELWEICGKTKLKIEVTYSYGSRWYETPFRWSASPLYELEALRSVRKHDEWETRHSERVTYVNCNFMECPTHHSDRVVEKHGNASIMSLAGLRPSEVVALRHADASLLIFSGLNVAEVSQRLSHSVNVKP